MKRALLLATLLASPAYAVQPNSGNPAKGEDPRICTAEYKENGVLEVAMPIFKSLVIRVDPTEEIIDMAVSDDAHLNHVKTDYSTKNTLFLRAIDVMEPQPIGMRTRRKDGSFRDYAIQFSAFEDHLPPQVVQIAENGQIATTFKSLPVQPYCYRITYTYAADRKAEQAATWQAQTAKKRSTEAEALLHEPSQAWRNNLYVPQGDIAIAPASPGPGENPVWDDGYTTVLNYPGNLHEPVIVTRSGDGSFRQVDGITHEPGGIIRLHGVYKYLQLIDGNQKLCLFNQGFNAVGRNPGTGTIRTDIERVIPGSKP